MRRPSSEVYAPGETVPLDYLPPDLAPMPYGAGPDDLEAVRTALWLNFGNVGLAAKALHTPAGQLARLVEQSPELRTDRDAARRMIVDRAEAVVVEQLSDEKNTDRRDEASKFVLTTLGKSLGWGSQATAPNGFSMSDGTRQLTVRWQTDP